MWSLSVQTTSTTFSRGWIPLSNRQYIVRQNLDTQHWLTRSRRYCTAGARPNTLATVQRASLLLYNHVSTTTTTDNANSPFLGVCRKLAATLWWFTAAPKPLKIQVFWGSLSPQGSHSPYILGDTTRPGHVTCVLDWSKLDRRQLRKTLHKQTNKQTDRQTDTTEIMVTWPWTNTLKFSQLIPVKKMN